MVTIVTEVQLKKGTGPKWDELMHERMVAAKEHPGWIGGQFLQPDHDPQRRMIVGTWRSRDDWQAWHTDARFQASRTRLDQLVHGPEGHSWHEVVLEVRRAGDGAA